VLYRAGPCWTVLDRAVPYRQTLHALHATPCLQIPKRSTASNPIQTSQRHTSRFGEAASSPRSGGAGARRSQKATPRQQTQTHFPVRPACLIWRYLTTMPKGGLRKSPALSASEHLRSTPGSESQNRNRNKFWRYHVSMACAILVLSNNNKDNITASKSSEGLERMLLFPCLEPCWLLAYCILPVPIPSPGIH
jgi:hypothetical protein